MKKRPLAERFWGKVDVRGTAECWPWTGAKGVRGYGRVSDDCRRKAQAHRVAWELSNGPIPDGLNVCHHCDNRPCVNPAHLFLGTNQDNMRDMVAKGRRKGPSGETHHIAKLSNADVAAILSDRRTQRAIARDYGVTRANISYIKLRKGWRDSPPA